MNYGVIAFSISSSKIGAIGIMKRSFAEFERSRSCHDAIFSIETSTNDRVNSCKRRYSLAFYGVALDWHSATSHLALAKGLGNFTYLGALQVPYLEGYFFKRGANKCYIKLHLSKPFSGYDLGCSIYRVKT